MTDEERARSLAEMSDDDIDYSDIPPLEDDLFASAKLVERKPRTELISIRIETDLLDWLRAKAPRYQTLINEILRTYVQHEKGKSNSSEKTRR
jgi:uncharacterized protein (DUF4415 family)